MSKKLQTCSREGVPVYQLALAKDRCARGMSTPLNSPYAIVQFFQQNWGCKPQEFFIVLHLNSRNEVIGAHEVGMGGIDSTPVDPKIVFGGALMTGASAIIICHNHPSGEPNPSAADRDLTARLVEAGKLLTIKVLDHIIVARGGASYSMASMGSMPR